MKGNLKAFVLITGLILFHWMLCRIVWAWWVPDVPLIGVVLLIAADPRRWLVVAGTAGLMAMSWTVPAPAMALAWYGGAGALVRGLGRVVDLGDPRMQLVVIGVAETLWLAWHVWLQSAPVVPIAGWSVLHVAVTLLAVPWLRRVMPAAG